MTDDNEKWYFNISEEIPQKGKLTNIENRMGPYNSREEAVQAWEIVKKRNKKWEEDDKKWNDFGGESSKNESSNR